MIHILNLFRKKDKPIYFYNMMEKVKIAPKEADDSLPKLSEIVAEDDKYIFYGWIGYLLRQDKKNKNKIVFFGARSKFTILYKGHVFLANQGGKAGMFSIQSREENSGKFYKYDSWLGQHAIFECVTGDGHFWCQDTIENYRFDDEKLVFHILRRKSNENEYPEKVENPVNDPLDIDMEYDLTVEESNGGFIPVYHYYL